MIFLCDVGDIGREGRLLYVANAGLRLFLIEHHQFSSGRIVKAGRMESAAISAAFAHDRD
jgi:hypothetical protein